MAGYWRAERPRADAATVPVGFLFQGAALFDSMTVFENVAFSLREQGRHTEQEIEERVRHRLQEVGACEVKQEAAGASGE